MLCVGAFLTGDFMSVLNIKLIAKKGEKTPINAEKTLKRQLRKQSLNILSSRLSNNISIWISNY